MRKLFSGNVTLAATVATTIGTFDVTECESVGIDLKNMGAGALTAFELYGRASPDGDFVLLAAGNFGSSGWWTRWASTEPAALAAGASALVQITVEELSNIRLVAKSTAGSQLKVNVVGWETAR